MGVLLFVLLLILILFLLGITGVVKLLLWIAIIAFIIWLIGFFVRAPKARAGTAGSGLAEDVQVRQVPVALVQVEAVADEELVGDGEADVPDRQVVDEPAVRAVEERHRCE